MMNIRLETTNLRPFGKQVIQEKYSCGTQDSVKEETKTYIICLKER
mgnify:CR=1 FL=1